MTLPDLTPAFVERHDVPTGSIRQAAVARRRRRRIGQAGAALGLAAAVVVGGVLPGERSAFADWTPEPGPLDERLVAQTEERCAASFAFNATHVLDGEGIDEATMAQHQAVYGALAGQAPILVDQRGNGALALYLSEGGPVQPTVVTCSWVWDPADLHGEPAGGSSGWDDGVTPPDATLSVFSWGHQELQRLGRAGRFSDLHGVIELEGARAVVTLADGQKVAARDADGRFLAWWPGAVEPVRVEAVDAEGRVVERLERVGLEWAPAPLPTG